MYSLEKGGTLKEPNELLQKRQLVFNVTLNSFVRKILWSLMLCPRVPRQVGRSGELRRAGRAAVAGGIGGRGGGRVPVRDRDVPVMQDGIAKLLTR